MFPLLASFSPFTGGGGGGLVEEIKVSVVQRRDRHAQGELHFIPLILVRNDTLVKWRDRSKADGGACLLAIQ